jgi:hypothetical protein
VCSSRDAEKPFHGSGSIPSSVDDVEQSRRAVLTVVTLLAAAALVAPGASAASVVGPPEDVEATYEEEVTTIELTWEAPTVGADDAHRYNVYLDGEVVVETPATEATVEVNGTEGFVWITAETPDTESAPSEPLIIRGSAGNPCVVLTLGDIPPVFVNPSCLDDLPPVPPELPDVPDLPGADEIPLIGGPPAEGVNDVQPPSPSGGA